MQGQCLWRLNGDDVWLCHFKMNANLLILSLAHKKKNNNNWSRSYTAKFGSTKFLIRMGVLTSIFMLLCFFSCHVGKHWSKTVGTNYTKLTNGPAPLTEALFHPPICWLNYLATQQCVKMKDCFCFHSDLNYKINTFCVHWPGMLPE